MNTRICTCLFYSDFETSFYTPLYVHYIKIQRHFDLTLSYYCTQKSENADAKRKVYPTVNRSSEREEIPNDFLVGLGVAVAVKSPVSVVVTDTVAVRAGSFAEAEAEADEAMELYSAGLL